MDALPSLPVWFLVNEQWLWDYGLPDSRVNIPGISPAECLCPLFTTRELAEGFVNVHLSRGIRPLAIESPRLLWAIVAEFVRINKGTHVVLNPSIDAPELWTRIPVSAFGVTP
jgi:hypothetical protein